MRGIHGAVMVMHETLAVKSMRGHGATMNDCGEGTERAEEWIG